MPREELLHVSSERACGGDRGRRGRESEEVVEVGRDASLHALEWPAVHDHLSGGIGYGRRTHGGGDIKEESRREAKSWLWRKIEREEKGKSGLV